MNTVPIAIPLAIVAFCTGVLCLWTLAMSRGALKVISGLGTWSVSLALQTGGWAVWSAISFQPTLHPAGIAAGNSLLILGLAAQSQAIRRALGFSPRTLLIYGGFAAGIIANGLCTILIADIRWRIFFGSVYVIILLGDTARLLWLSGRAGGLNHRFLSVFYLLVAAFFTLRLGMIFFAGLSLVWWLYSAHVVSVAFCFLSSFGFFALCNQVYAALLRQSEHSSRENEILLNFALDSTVDAIWDLDFRTGRVVFSKRWEEMLGFSPGELENDLARWEERIHPADLALLNEIFWQYSIGKIPEYECNQRIRAKNGEYVWIKDRGIIVSRDEEGNPLRFVGTLKNIDAQVKKAGEHRRNHILLEQIFSRSPVGISLLTAEGIPIRQNPAVMQMYALTEELLQPGAYLANRVFDSAGRRKRPEDFPYIKAVAQPGKVISDYLGVEFDGGHLRYFAVNAVYLEALDMVMTFSTDLTELEVIETELRNTQIKFRSVFEALPVGVSLLDRNRRVVEVNQAMVDITGIPRDDMNDTVRAERVYYRLDGTTFGVQEIPLVRDENGLEALTNFIFGLDVDGMRKWFSMRIKPMSDIGLSATIVSDVSDVIGFQRELSALNLTLEERVAMRTQELDFLNSELESFSYSVSHDLRAPLTRIHGWVNALADDFRNSLGEKAVSYVARIRNEINRMEAMIKATMALARASSAPLHIAEVDLSALAEEIIRELRAEFPARLILADIQPHLIAQGDRPLLELMLRNLLHNAVKFSSKKEHIDIHFGSAFEAGEKTFFIRDNGVGFNPRFADKLFAPFQRLHSESDFPGTGVGLATVRRIIHRHGGHIRADSAPENGTTFFFNLAVKAEE